MYKIEYTPTFEKDLDALDKSIIKRIFTKIEWLQLHPETLRFPLKYMPQELKNLNKYRIGDYRVLLWINHGQKVITLYGVEHRRSVYKNL
ncbi:MAG: hypothetical protein A2231_04140 [Candidatus Firestonebacteria bacterium RIFOXYA2_FULL_40_8]|nr:MAG: hypothetical protein A2231_04140 [Candidatus Firestonebacteria bacterium RIFOXYA2_FULL_40_8]